MHNPESILENETPKILCDFKIQKDHLISVRRQDLVIVYKKKMQKDHLIPVKHRVNTKEHEKRRKYFDLAREV